MAACWGNKDLMVMLLNNPRCISLINKTDKLGKTSLHYAVKHKQFSTMRLLCENGIDVTVATYLGNTALHYAATMDSVEAAIILLSYNTSNGFVNAVNNEGKSFHVKCNFILVNENKLVKL